MDITQYEEKIVDTALYGNSINNYVNLLEIPNEEKREQLKHLLRVVYNVLGLAGEAGELAEKMKKIVRDKQSIFSEEDIKNMKLENGDVLWYTGALSKELNSSLNEVAQLNIDKLQSRKNRNVINGSGDNR